MSKRATTVHASCVAFGRHGLLIVGPSGSGKSALALDLISRGAVLVADDRVILKATGGMIFASCPDTIKGRIEARWVGILAVKTAETALITNVVDLEKPETKRLPERHKTTLLGVEVDLVNGKGNPLLAQALHLLMLGGRTD